jgi:hypothetical protein
MPKRSGIFFCFLLLLLFLCGPAGSAEEMYILTTRDGSEIIVKDFRITDEYIEFTTGNDLPGFIRKENLAEISNMVGVQPSLKENQQTPETVERIRQREIWIWIGTAAGLVLLYLVYLLLVVRRKKDDRQEPGGISPGRIERPQKTHGHLRFSYRERSGRQKEWVIEVAEAYEENGKLFIEGICTATGRRKTFRADRVNGPATDLSSGRQYRIENLFRRSET